MKEITIYGRGGQGAVTAAQILATAAMDRRRIKLIRSSGQVISELTQEAR